jgi:cyclic pyranopterin phosphate synthase
MTPLLKDKFQRRIRKLRVSLLDRCNFRCKYCMPENAVFASAKDMLSADELLNILTPLVRMGIEQIRLTGGEPTLRRDLIQITERISELPLQSLGLTTNGFALKKFLPELRETRCQHLNISLDSLRPNVFKEVARFDGYEATLDAIFSAKEMGFKVKINTVVMRGVNDNEIGDFVEFATKYGIEVRFLELMSIGASASLQKNAFVSADEILKIVGQLYDLEKVDAEIDSTSLRYRTANGGRIGLIAPVTKSFCSTCSRWRLKANGTLQACLMDENGINLRGLTDEKIKEQAMFALDLKPMRGAAHTNTMMHQMGG